MNFLRCLTERRQILFDLHKCIRKIAKRSEIV